MFTIALTGGIASGKSSFADDLREYGAVVISADEVAREVVEPGEFALEEIRRAFGDGVIHADGTLDRQALASIVFGDEAKRRELESITHPAIRQRVDQRILGIRASDPYAIGVYDIPLLLGSSQEHSFFMNVSVSASEDSRVERMVHNRGMTAAEARARIDSQPTDAEREAISDVVVHNDGTREQLKQASSELWTLLTAAVKAVSDSQYAKDDSFEQNSFPRLDLKDNLHLHVKRLEKAGVEVIGTTRSLPAHILLNESPPADVLSRFGWIRTMSGALSANPAVGTTLSFAS